MRSKLVKGCTNNRNDVLIDKNNKWCLHFLSPTFAVESKGIVREDSLMFKGRRPHLVQTIDDTSLPRDICDPTSALQTFRSRRDDVSPWSALIGWALLHQAHQILSKLRFSKSVDSQSVIFVGRRGLGSRVIEFYVHPSTVLAVIGPSLIISVFNAIDFQGESLTLIRPFLIPLAAPLKSSILRDNRVTFVKKQTSVNIRLNIIRRTFMEYPRVFPIFSNVLHQLR